MWDRDHEKKTAFVRRLTKLGKFNRGLVTDTDSLLSMNNEEICLSTAEVTSKISNTYHTHI